MSVRGIEERNEWWKGWPFVRLQVRDLGETVCKSSLLHRIVLRYCCFHYAKASTTRTCCQVGFRSWILTSTWQQMQGLELLQEETACCSEQPEVEPYGPDYRGCGLYKNSFSSVEISDKLRSHQLRRKQNHKASQELQNGQAINSSRSCCSFDLRASSRCASPYRYSGAQTRRSGHHLYLFRLEWRVFSEQVAEVVCHHCALECCRPFGRDA